MGSEQSSQAPQHKQTQRAPPITRGHTISVPHVPDAMRAQEPSPSGNNSPGASVCSDSELPYISYTVNRPIGDSPKTSAKSTNSQPRTAEAKRTSLSALQRRQLSLQPRRPKKVHDIVVVKEAKSMPNVHSDEDVRRLQEIPTFLPIMRGTLGLPGARDPEVMEGLDYRPWVGLTSRYQAHLAACAQPVSADQLTLTCRVKETDAEMSRILVLMVEKQHQNAKNAERLSKVKEISQQLTRCHSILNHCIETTELLNNMLPIEDRLEPFVWTTG